MENRKKEVEEVAAFDLGFTECNRLAKCIVARAVVDWIRLSTGKDLPTPEENFSELKRFFRSEYFEAIYPNISGAYAIKKLEAQYPSRYPKIKEDENY